MTSPSPLAPRRRTDPHLLLDAAPDAAAGLAAGALALALTRAVAPTGAGALGTAVFVVVCLAGAALARTVRHWWTGPPQCRPEPTEVSAAIAAMDRQATASVPAEPAA
ncbi:hypothetical protein [uncultured Actinomyces sp.]|uniref:hypothetical protein n=1 Tax=uncultured Actinomyces sp. TaxID=249061 RepID=UPI002889708E|nr:hypothetical protein [uncultured Actinomyces sp.]